MIVPRDFESVAGDLVKRQNKMRDFEVDYLVRPSFCFLWVMIWKGKIEHGNESRIKLEIQKYTEICGIVGM